MLVQALIERGILAPAEAERAMQVSQRSGARLGATLTRLGMVDEGALAVLCAELAGLPLLRRDELVAPLPDGLNPRFLRRRSVLPLIRPEGWMVAIADPWDDEALAAMAFAADGPVQAAVASYSDIHDALGSEHDDEMLGGVGDDMALGDLDRLAEGDSDAPVIRLVDRLLTAAVNRRASDVHIEPMARQVVVRYRIDGRLIEVEHLPDGLAAPTASRIKVMAGLDIAETRLPQDGRLKLAVRGREVDVRVATSPVAHGESIVLRLLGQAHVPLDLDQLGLPAKALAALGQALERPHGIILVTGPTGSGKTTTLYAAINRLRRPDVKILTVEDPVEVQLDGINQVQVRPEIDLTYAATLRAFLRQDPDILMIGEIRDRETAEIAMRAALTGHLVLSTLHTNSAAGAFTRLADIGIEPYLTTSTVIAVLAQRLIRGLCACAGARPILASEAALFERQGLLAPATLPQPQGCEACGGTGYRGRLPLLELIEVDEPARDLIRRGDAPGLAARQRPTETLLGHGLALVAAGRTTLGEVQRMVTLG